MEFVSGDSTFRARFLEPQFEAESFIDTIASKSIGSIDLMNVRKRMHLISREAKAELKLNVYRNHEIFIGTAKEISSLEAEVYQLNTFLSDQKQLLNTVKELLNVENMSNSSEATDNDSCQTLVHHCQSLGLITQNPERQLIYSGKLIEIRIENLSLKTSNKSNSTTKQPASYVTHQCYAILCSDYFILAKSTNIRTATAYDVDQVIKLHQTSTAINNNRQSDKYKQDQSSSAIQIINVKDDVLRNSFLIKHNLETLTLMCENAQSKKHWLEMIESACYPQQRRGSLFYVDAGPFSASPAPQQPQQPLEEEFYSDEWITDTNENLIILLAERNFDEALVLISRARKYAREFLTKHSGKTIQFVDEYIKDVQIKEQELCKLIEKEGQNTCERGCSRNSLKHFYHHIQILKQLGYIAKACDLFINIQSSLLKTTLKETKLEELNVTFVESFSNRFFTCLANSYYEFEPIFKDEKSTFTKFIVWISSEIKDVISVLRNQEYISTKKFRFTIKNIDILLTKANEFSKLFDIKFILEEQLEKTLIEIINTQKDVIINILRQKHNDEKWIPVTFPSRGRLDELCYEFQELGIDSEKCLQPYITTINGSIKVNLTSSTLYFAKAYLTFSRDLFKVHYPVINQVIVKALLSLIERHSKHIENALQNLRSTDELELKMFIMKNVDFSLNQLYHHMDILYKPKVGHLVEQFTTVFEKMLKLKEIASA